MLTYLEKLFIYQFLFFVESVQIIPVTILTNGNFVAALSNKSSTEYQKRAMLIKAGVSVMRMRFIGRYVYTY